MPPRVSREEWDRRAAAVGIEWVGDEPIYSHTKHAARCLSCGHEWFGSPKQIAKGQGCPSCANQKRADALIAEAAAAIPLVLQDDERRYDVHPVLDLIRRPNGAQGRAERLMGQ